MRRFSRLLRLGDAEEWLKWFGWMSLVLGRPLRRTGMSTDRRFFFRGGDLWLVELILLLVSADSGDSPSFTPFSNSVLIAVLLL